MCVGQTIVSKSKIGGWQVVLLFKGITPLSQFSATVASGAPPRPKHGCFQGVDVPFETPWRGIVGALCDAHNTSFSNRETSLVSTTC